MTLALLAASAGCSAAEPENGSEDVGDVSISQVALSRDQAREMYFANLNRWIDEQDRTRAPAPSVEVPQEFSEGRCTLLRADLYRCEYRVKFGRGWQSHTQQMVRRPDRTWHLPNNR